MIKKIIFPSCLAAPGFRKPILGKWRSYWFLSSHSYNSSPLFSSHSSLAQWLRFHQKLSALKGVSKWKLDLLMYELRAMSLQCSAAALGRWVWLHQRARLEYSSLPYQCLQHIHLDFYLGPWCSESMYISPSSLNYHSLQFHLNRQLISQCSESKATSRFERFLSSARKVTIMSLEL